MTWVLTRVSYTVHLRTRLQTRKFPENLPRVIFEEAGEVCHDSLRPSRGGVEIVTIHPIRKEQETSRVKTGRWNRIG